MHQCLPVLTITSHSLSVFLPLLLYVWLAPLPSHHDNSDGNNSKRLDGRKHKTISSSPPKSALRRMTVSVYIWLAALAPQTRPGVSSAWERFEFTVQVRFVFPATKPGDNQDVTVTHTGSIRRTILTMANYIGEFIELHFHISPCDSHMWCRHKRAFLDMSGFNLKEILFYLISPAK